MTPGAPAAHPLEASLPLVTPTRARSHAFVATIAIPSLLLAAAGCGGGDAAAPPVPSVLAKTAGDGMTASVASTTTTSPTIQVRDENGRPVRNVIVNFAVSNGGSLAATVDTSDASGIATSGAWTLGTAMGQQTVTATSPQVAGATATFTATAVAGPATQLVFITQPPTASQAGVQFQGPVVELRDAFGNRSASTATVTLSLSSSSGAANLTGTTSVAAVDGRATFGLLSTTSTGVLTMIASAQGVAGQALSSQITIASGTASALVKVSGDVQLGDAGTNVFLPPTVKVTDSFGNAISGAIVTFSVVSGGGSVGGPVTSGADGLATLSGWTLGPAVGDQVVRATMGAVTVDFTATALAANAYHIELRYVNTPTRRQQQAFEAAWQKWRSVITGDIPDGLVPEAISLSPCGSSATVPANTLVDDLIIYIELRNIDGPNNILGSATPCLTRNTGTLLPAVGTMTFDTSDLPSLEALGQLDQVILHEMGHVLGITRSRWAARGLAVGAGSDSSGFSGAAATAAWNALGGAGTRVPVENCVGITQPCGEGTRDSHWRERTFNNELMTGYLNGGIANPLSAVTIASLQDLGYVVNMGAAEAYSLPASVIVGGVAGAVMSQGPRRPIIEGPVAEPRAVVVPVPGSH
jgi:hypothetical protein